MKNLIFYKTTADFDNTGEVLIYKSLLQFLRKYGDVIINDGDSIQPQFLERIGIKEQERLSNRTNSSFIAHMLCTALRNMFSPRQIYFVTGVGEHSVRTGKAALKNFFAIGFIGLMRCCGVKAIRIGMSMRFSDNFLAKQSERMLSHLFNHYYVRDSISLNNCHEAGVKKCQLAPDLSWGYAINVPTTGTNEDKNVIIFSFRNYCEPGTTGETYKKLLTGRILALITFLSEKKIYKIWLTHQCNEDYTYAKEIYDLLPTRDRVELKQELVTLDNGEEYYGKAVITLSNRLHVMLLAYKFGSPTVCLTDVEKHRKITGIFLDNNLGNVLMDINEPTDKLCGMLDKLITDKDCLESNIKNAEARNLEKLDSIFGKMFIRKQ